jgi:two-component system nitrogen regulation response regulator GlnG
MGESDSIKRLAVDVSRVARSTFTVLIQGETGTGKEAIAHALHQASSRSKGPFVPVDCGAIPETLIESHLFGYEKGAFTGAQSQTHGTFEAASGGTLFLDEISNLSLSSQSKLLRVLQERAIYRVGGTKSIPVDARLVAASNHDLQTMVESGSFRSDLFFRLNEFAIRVPALRERKEDVLFLAKRFCDITSIELKKTPPQFSQSAIAALLAYDWPGNVRQLRSSIRRAVLLADGVITHDNLDIKTMLVSAFAPRLHEVSWDDSSLKEIVRRSTITVEREILNQVLRKTGGNKARAARLLQVDYKTIHSKVKEYGIAIDGGGYNGREEKGHVARN